MLRGNVWVILVLFTLSLSVIMPLAIVMRFSEDTSTFKRLEHEEPGMSEIVIVRKITTAGLDFIKMFEQGPRGGFAPVPYRCSAGFMTIGWGHEIVKGEVFNEPISEDTATAILLRDLLIAERSVCRLISVPLYDWQYDALVSFTFNLGGGRLQVSTLRQVVNREEHVAAPNQFRRWVYAGARKLNGLVRRRNAEAMMYAGN